MPEPIRERYGRWRLEELLHKYPGLRIRPSRSYDLRLAGTLAFRVQGPAGEPLEDVYDLDLRVPADFPTSLPVARETGGRIPPSHHTLDDGSLCLGAPTALRLLFSLSPTLFTVVEGCVIPYLFGYSYLLKHGKMPFGELDHGPNGLRQHFATLFGVARRATIDEFVRLVSLRKRQANKAACPCGSGRRLGRCHHRRVNLLRVRLGRRWFREQFKWLTEGTSGRRSADTK